MTSPQSVVPTCYRHSDRETRLACSHCGRPVCVDCVRSAPVGQRCLECAKDAQGRNVQGMDAVTRGGTGVPVVTFALIAVCMAIFAAQYFVPEMEEPIIGRFAQYNDAIAFGQWWRTITAAFLHGGPGHLLLNMFSLYILGPYMERQVGSAAFAVAYVACAVAGGVAYYFLVPGGAAVGASGAIFGLFGVYLVAAFRARHSAAGQSNLRGMLILLAVNLAWGFQPGTQIAWQAHLGGLAAGLIIALLWSLPALRGKPLPRVIAAGAVGLAALAAVL